VIFALESICILSGCGSNLKASLRSLFMMQKQSKSSRQTISNLIYSKNKFKIYAPKSFKILNFDRLQKGLGQCN